jgi:hypothetical protein
MQLFTLAGFLFSLAALSVAAPMTERTGPCTEERQHLGKPIPGKFLPACTDSGYYQPKQCHGSTGYCWCVNPETGKEIQGTQVPPGNGEPQCPTCFVQRAQALRPGLIGGYVPTCDENGLFVPTQFHASTGQSWCVDRYTGESFEETRRMPGEERPECTGSRYCKKGETEGRPCCAMYFQESSSLYRLECTRNGYFMTEQTVPFSDVPIRFCVNPATGVQARETHAPNCGACFKELEEKLGGKQLLGSDMPQCHVGTGQYLPVQKSHDGYRYCVDPKTGAKQGEKLRLDDNGMLPCEHHH